MTAIVLNIAKIQPVYADTTFTVDDLGDASDADAGNGTCATAGAVCTLRAAIEESNALGGNNTIDFSVSGTINIAAALTITNGGLIIDGGVSHDVVVNGTGTSGVNCFDITTSSNIIEGLVVQNCNVGFYIHTDAGDANEIQNCYSGTNAAGDAAVANNDGVVISVSADNNIIGTDGDGTADSAERNVISGNTRYGVYIVHTGTSNNVVAGNYIGLNAAGTSAVANGQHGVYTTAGASSNTIGTDGDGTADSAERNVISGNSVYGVYILNTGTSNNVVAGNYIGLNAAGTSAVANGHHGVAIFSGPSSNTIGTDSDGTADSAERNVISGNTYDGVIVGTGSNSNVVAGNYIGTGADGTTDIGNGRYGICIIASSNTIGTDGDGTADSAERNIISGNTQYGVYILNTGTSNNVVAGNYIGLNAAGTSAVANGFYGVYIFGGASSNTIGTDGDGTADSAERNVISGNTYDGIVINGAGTDNNVAAGNYIGTGTDGTTDIGNGRYGIHITGTSSSNTIGGVTVTEEANIIAYNGNAASEHGIYINTAGADYNKITRNSTFSNQDIGIKLDGGSNEGISVPAITGSAEGGVAATITLSGTCPVDASGVTVELFESDGSGEGKTYITSTNSTDGNWSTNITSSYTEVGKKIVATVTNSTNSTSEFSTEYTIPDINAVASTTGSDTSVDEGDTANLVGTASYDPNSGDTVTYLWERIAGEEVTIIDPTSANASFEAPQVPGGGSSTTIRLTVNTDEDTDQVVVTINDVNTTPTVDSVYVSDTSLEKNDDFNITGITIIGGSGKDIYINGVVGDTDGADTIATVEAVFYRENASDGSGSGCTADDNDCYKVAEIATCTLSANDDTHKDYDCAISLEYWVDATTAGGAYPDEVWKVYVKVIDQETASATHTTHADIEMNTVLSLNIPTSIAYDTHALGFSNTAADNQHMTITQKGNDETDVEVSGIAMTCTGIGSIPVGNQEWSLTDVDHDSGTDLTGSAVVTNLNVGYRTNDEAELTKILYWSIEIPATGVLSTCTGTNTITAYDY
ncbi:MAG: hypothetical protein HQ530_03545 [Parcubacteria group bacterium]|nr:hypothetical protein [Parcubacteria group bacterium]